MGAKKKSKDVAPRDPLKTRLRQLVTEFSHSFDVEDDDARVMLVDHVMTTYEDSLLDAVEGMIALSVMDLTADDED